MQLEAKRLHSVIAALLVAAVAACGSGSKIEPNADSAALEELGKQLFDTKGCTACHSVDGSARIGPTLKAAFGKRVQLTSGREVVFDEAYFVESVFEPNVKIVVGFAPDLQPSFEGQLDDDEMKALIAFVKSR